MSTVDVLEIFREKDVSRDDIVSLMVEKYASEIEIIQTEDINIVDVDKTMHQLTQVGDLLMVADKTSDGFHVNVAIKGLLAKYQILLRDCVSELTYFTQTAKHALETHVDAVYFIDDSEYGEALILISGCIDYAKDLSTRSEKLADRSDEMITDTNIALEEASEQDVKNQEDLKELADLKREQEAEQAERATRAIDLAKEVKDFRKREEDAKARAEKLEDHAYTMGIVKSIFSPIMTIVDACSKGDPADKVNNDPEVKTKKEKVSKLKKEEGEAKKKITEAEKMIKDAEENQMLPEGIAKLNEELSSGKKALKLIQGSIKSAQKSLDDVMDKLSDQAMAAQQNALRYEKLLREKREQEIENNAKIARLASEIANSDIEIGEVHTAIKMIKLTIRALGNITTAFNNTKLFWDQQAAAFKRLAELGESTEKYLTKFQEREIKSYMKLVKNGVYKSGMKWLTLYKINHTASVAIRDVYANINEIMRHLGGLESKEEIVAQATKVLDQIVDAMNAEAAEKAKGITDS